MIASNAACHAEDQGIEVQSLTLVSASLLNAPSGRCALGALQRTTGGGIGGRQVTELAPGVRLLIRSLARADVRRLRKPYKTFDKIAAHVLPV